MLHNTLFSPSFHFRQVCSSLLLQDTMGWNSSFHLHTWQLCFQTGCLVSLYKIASKCLNVEILQILFLKTTLLFYLYFSERVFTSFQCIYWIVFRDIKIWHFCKILGYFQFIKEKRKTAAVENVGKYSQINNNSNQKNMNCSNNMNCWHFWRKLRLLKYKVSPYASS